MGSETNFVQQLCDYIQNGSPDDLFSALAALVGVVLFVCLIFNPPKHQFSRPSKTRPGGMEDPG